MPRRKTVKNRRGRIDASGFEPHQPPPGQEATALDALSVVAPMVGGLATRAGSAAVRSGAQAAPKVMPGDFLAGAKSGQLKPLKTPLQKQTEAMRRNAHEFMARRELMPKPKITLNDAIAGAIAGANRNAARNSAIGGAITGVVDWSTAGLRKEAHENARREKLSAQREKMKKADNAFKNKQLEARNSRSTGGVHDGGRGWANPATQAAAQAARKRKSGK